MKARYKHLLVERDAEDERIVWIKLNRPDRLNVMGLELLNELYEALAEADRDPSASAIIITGVGRGFCAGADLREIKDLGFEDAVRWLTAFSRVMDLIRNTGKLVVAAVRGPCVAGGLELALVCDLVVAAKSALLGSPEVKVGSTAYLAAELLPIVVGEKRAKEMLLTGRLLTAEEAKEAGLVNKVVEDGELEEEARKLALSVINRVCPMAFRVIKSIINFWASLGQLAWQVARDMTAAVWTGEEFRERAEAFLTKKEMRPGKLMGVMPERASP